MHSHSCHLSPLIPPFQSSILDKLAAWEQEQEAQKQTDAMRQFLSRVLSTHVAANTSYNEQGKRPCDSDTRIDILADIKKWVYDISEGAQCFLWLTGDPGSGKSAITASVARECKDSGILWAQFFINRDLDNTTNPAFYFPSIARQLADRSSDVALAIHDALKERPSLMDDISPLQAGKLFVESLKVASSTDSSKPVVVIIDGLDETHITRLRYTAQIFSQALLDLPNNAKVFISSRTEDDIRHTFSATFHVNHVKHIHLDTSTMSSIQDVSAFLARNIAEIVERNGIDVLEWPGEQRIMELCKQASGLFIWAVTAVKFIQDQVDACGRECLSEVFEELNSRGMGDINVLYNTILRLTHRNQTDPWVFERFRRIVGCIVILREPLCLTDIASLLHLRKDKSNTAVDVLHHVRRLRTVLIAGAGPIDGQSVPRLHKSFYEFITSDRTDPRFHINTNISHGEITIQCLRQLVSFSENSATYSVNDTPSVIPAVSSMTLITQRFLAIPRSSGKYATVVHAPKSADEYFTSPLRYACQHWTWHFPPHMTAGVAVAGSLKLHHIYELFQFASRGCTQLPSVHVSLSVDGGRIISSSDNVISLWDAGSGARLKYPLKGHSGAVYSVAFSPDGTRIISGGGDNTLRLWDARSGLPIGSPFKGHTRNVCCVAFSPDGKQIISGSVDTTLRLWNADGGSPVKYPLKGHNGAIFSVAFSPDGCQIVSGSGDNTLRLWDTGSGRCLRHFIGHISIVNSVAFSPDGKQIVSGSSDHTIRLWDVHSGLPNGSPLRGHTYSVEYVTFTPDGKRIISGSSDYAVRIWDVKNSLLIEPRLKGHTGTVYSVAVSPNGKQIVSGSSDQTLRLWDAKSGQLIGSLEGHTSTVYSVAFSPDGKHIISGSADRTICLWDVASCQLIELSFHGHENRLTSIALSPDGTKIISASLDDTIRVWDAFTGLSIGPPLKGDINRVVTLSFSPDGRQFAAASCDSTVCLWGAEDHILIASYCNQHINAMSSIAFSPDGRQLITFSIDGTTHTWNAANGKPIITSNPSGISLSASRIPFNFNMERGWCHGEADNALLRWIPVDNPDFGHWVYIDSKLIRRDKAGLTTITDMTAVQQKWLASLFGEEKV